jgi:hypothetical protein
MPYTDLKIQLPELDVINNSILKISIDNEWSAYEFGELFKSLNIIYKSKFWTYKALRASNDFINLHKRTRMSYAQFEHSPIGQLLDVVKKQLKDIESENNINRYAITASYHDVMFSDVLKVKRIIYASPGSTDLFGLSGILKEIKDILMYYFPNQKDKEQAEIIKQRKIELQIKNLKAIGFSEIEIRTILLREDVHLEKLSNFVDRGLISNVELVDQ